MEKLKYIWGKKPGPLPTPHRQLRLFCLQLSSGIYVFLSSGTALFRGSGGENLAHFFFKVDCAATKRGEMPWTKNWSRP